MGPQAFVDAMRRYLNLIVRPEDEWSLVAAEKPSLGEALIPFTVIGLAVSVVASLVGALLRTGDGNVPLEVTMRLVVNAGSVAAFAAASGLVARRMGAVRPAMGEVAALYASTGLWLATILAFVPVLALNWLWFLMGAAYTGYLYHQALDSAVGIPIHARVKSLLLVMAALLVASSCLRIIELVVCG